MKRLAGFLVASLLCWPAIGQTTPFVLTPAPGGTVTYSAGVSISFSVPVIVTQTANSITFTWGAVPPIPVPPAPPSPPAIAAGANLYIIAFFDKSAPVQPPAAVLGLLGQDSVDRINANVKTVSTKASTTYVSSDVTSPTLGAWLADKTQAPCLMVIATDANGKWGIATGYPVPLPSGATTADVEAALTNRIKAMRSAT